MTSPYIQHCLLDIILNCATIQAENKTKTNLECGEIMSSNQIVNELDHETIVRLMELIENGLDLDKSNVVETVDVVRQVLRKAAEESENGLFQQADKVFTLFWLTGASEIVSGKTVDYAFAKAGYGAGARSALDFWSEGDKRDEREWKDDGSGKKAWVSKK